MLGDISEFATLHFIFDAHPFSCVIASGIACQPYSQLGDQKDGSTLPATLSAAFYLRAMIVMIECVGHAQNKKRVPASTNQKTQIAHSGVQ